MCGIAGIFHLETPRPVDPARLKMITDTLGHRGPDGEGYWLDQGIGLGHKRLSIIDLEGGAQPMASDDARDIIVFNGEIYNFRELRRELEPLGHIFIRDSDTEVILAAWREWGVNCLSRLNGMFAFAIYDRKERSLFLARDRLGIKPLHYAQLSDGSMVFASELKGLLAHPLLRRRPDLHALDAYLAFGYVPDDHCLIAGVKKLGAGQYLHAYSGKKLPRPISWWDVDFTRRAKGKQADLEAELLHHVQEAVRLRMVADVPLGAFLSGGVDSSAMVALMSEQSNRAVNSFTIGFEEKSLDESGYAQNIAARFATNHHSQVVRPGDLMAIDHLMGFFDEPFADAAAVPSWYLSKLAREQVIVALSGDGADEALAGYRRHIFHHHEGKLRNLMPQGLRGPLFGSLARIWPKADWAPRPFRAKATLASLSRSGASAYVDAVGVSDADLRHKGLYSADLTSQLDGYVAEDMLIAMMQRAPARSGLDAAQYADLKSWLPGDILTKTDRMSMAVGLEARVPMIDYHLVEFAASLPENMRVRGGEGKYLLKKAMEKRLPDEILYRPKMGFVMPIAHWFRAELADDARRIVSGSALIASGWFDPAKLAKIAEAHISGRRDHGRLLWQLWMLDKALIRLFP